jgi:hypothetical protein
LVFINKNSCHGFGRDDFEKDGVRVVVPALDVVVDLVACWWIVFYQRLLS